MLGRIFGRGKDESGQSVCAECGRTLLAGEWTQKVVDADGEELLICSLCGQTHALSGVEPVDAQPTPANNGRMRESREEIPQPSADERQPSPEVRDSRTESDAFWRALKEKDAEIESLRAQLARLEAEKQALAGQPALARAAGPDAAPAAAPTPQAEVVPAEPLVPSVTAAAAVATTAVASPTGDSSEPGERTWGETPAEFAAELAALRNETAAEPAAQATDVPPVVAAPTEVPAIVFEDTQPIPAITDEQVATAAVMHTPDEAPETTLTPEPQPAAAAVSSIAAETAELEAAAPPPADPDPGRGDEPAAEEAPAALSAADLEAEAASLTLLQRGVDLLNVSRVPHKIAETNEQLGMPSVHVGLDGDATAVTFMWSMGWYLFHVDLESGNVRMADRGYDELTDLRPNAGVRADGTVQLAPAQISRAATAQRPQPEAQQPAPQSADEPTPSPSEPEPPSVAAQKPPEILSKSLLGQRSDDEAASWEKTQARDFDWDR